MNFRSYHEIPPVETATGSRVVGQSVVRLEDPPLVRGEACFAADINFPRQLHMRVVRSQVAHGHLASVDTFH
jgi:carbon-monoxide dehydrogenase large subunit